MIQKSSIFHYSKNCGSLTCVTRLKVAVDIVDPSLLGGPFVPLRGEYTCAISKLSTLFEKIMYAH